MLFLLNARNSAATRGGDLSSRLERTGGQPHRRGTQWDCPGNKVRSYRKQSAASSCPNRCPRDYWGPSRCAGDERKTSEAIAKMLQINRSWCGRSSSSSSERDWSLLAKAATAASVSDTPHLA